MTELALRPGSASIFKNALGWIKMNIPAFFSIATIALTVPATNPAPKVVVVMTFHVEQKIYLSYCSEFAKPTFDWYNTGMIESCMFFFFFFYYKSGFPFFTIYFYFFFAFGSGSWGNGIFNNMFCFMCF